MRRATETWGQSQLDESRVLRKADGWASDKTVTFVRFHPGSCLLSSSFFFFPYSVSDFCFFFGFFRVYDSGHWQRIRRTAGLQ